VVRFHRKRALFLRTPSLLLEEGLAAREVSFVRRELGGGVLYLTAPRRGAAPAYWDYEQLLGVDLPP
jgi:hypothetical protein